MHSQIIGQQRTLISKYGNLFLNFFVFVKDPGRKNRVEEEKYLNITFNNNDL